MRTHLAACVSACALAAALVTPFVAAGGCSTSSSSGTCAAEGTVTVTVTNQVDSDTNFVCNATVTIAVTGGAPKTLTPQGFDGSNANCVYVTNVPPGSYTLTANATGYATGMELITIQEVGCVTSSPTEFIALIPTSASTDDGGTDDDADVIRDATANPG
jgi:hypothetical protein